MNRSHRQLEALMLLVSDFASETRDPLANEVAMALRGVVGSISSVSEMGDAFTPGFGREMYRFVAAQAKLSDIITKTKAGRGAKKKPHFPSSTETGG